MRWTRPIQTLLWITGLSLVPWSLAISEDEVEVTRIGINESTTRIQAEINQACGSESTAPLDYGFRCPRGTSAVAALSRGVSRSNLSLSATRNAFYREIPESIRQQFVSQCSAVITADVSRGFRCMEDVLTQAAQQPDRDPTFQIESAQARLRSFESAVLLRSVWTLACRRAAGDVVVRGSGRSRRLVNVRNPANSDASAGCTRPPVYTPLTAVAYQPSTALPDSSVDPNASLLALYQPNSLLFDRSESLRGCEGIIPHTYCGSGGRVDPLAVARDAALPITADFLDDIYDSLRDDHLQDWATFLSQKSADRALELIHLQFPPGTERSRRVEQLRQAAQSCGAGTAGSDAVALSRTLEAAGSPSTRAWNEGMVRTAQCLAADIDRWSELRRELGFDIEMVSTLIRPEEIDQLPNGVRHLARGVTSLPGVRHFLLEMPQLVGLNESATRTCGFLQESVAGDAPVSGVAGVAVPRASYCRAAYTEFMLLSYEIDSLYSAYPLLAQRASGNAGTALYEDIVREVGGRGSARAPSRASPEGCLDHVSQSDEAPLTENQRTQVQQVSAGRFDSLMEPLFAQIRAACDPDLREDLVAAAMNRPVLVEEFFNCDRPRFPALRATVPSASAPTAGGPWHSRLSPASCAERLDSSWLSCRLYDENQVRQDRNQALGALFTVGMDIMTLLTPFGGLASSFSVRSVGMSAGIGAGLGYVIAPSPEEAAIPSDIDAMLFVSGAGSIQSYEHALQTLDGLARRDPRWEAAITGAVTGGLLAGLAGEHATVAQGMRGAARLRNHSRLARLMDAEPAHWSAQMDLELVASYRSLERAGAFVDDIGREARSELDDLFIARLTEKYPEVPRANWYRMRSSDRLAILEGRLNPPAARGPPRMQAAVTEPVPPGSSPRVRAGVPEGPSGTSSSRSSALSVEQEAFLAINRDVPESLRLPTTAQNRSFISLAESAAQGRAEGLRFIEAENAALKALNDQVFGSKDIVNAVENRWRTLLLEEIRRDADLSRALRAEYQDFKSLRFAFTDSDSLGASFNTAYLQATRRFADEMRSGPFSASFETFSGRVGDPSRWHMASVGNTVDEAGAAARYARALDTPGGVPLQSIENAEGWLLRQVQESETLRSQWVSSLDREASAALLRRVSGPLSAQVPSEAVFELIRKVNWDRFDDGIRDLQGRIQRRFDVSLTEEQARMLRDYSQSVDAFSVGLLIPERVSNDLSPAAHGVVSADFAGQGGRNLAETAEALVRGFPDATHGDISSAISEARRAEVRATQLMRRLNDDFRDALARTVGRESVRRLSFSGDDGIFLPEADWTHADRVALASNLAQVSRTPANFRLTWIPTTYSNGAVIPSSARSGLVYLAEHAEKVIRSSLEGRVPREQLNQVVFMIEYLPDAAGGGTYQVVLSSAETGSLRAAGNQQALVRQVEDELRRFVQTENPGTSRAGAVEYSSSRRGLESPARDGGKYFPAPLQPWDFTVKAEGFFPGVSISHRQLTRSSRTLPRGSAKKMPVAAGAISR